MLQRWESLLMPLQHCSAVGTHTQVARTAAHVLLKLTTFCKCHTAWGYSSGSHVVVLYLPVTENSLSQSSSKVSNYA